MPDLNFAGDRVEDDTAHGPSLPAVAASILVAAAIIPAEKRKATPSFHAVSAAKVYAYDFGFLRESWLLVVQ